jgi:hypothetical protein
MFRTTLQSLAEGHSFKAKYFKGNVSQMTVLFCIVHEKSNSGSIRKLTRIIVTSRNIVLTTFIYKLAFIYMFYDLRA